MRSNPSKLMVVLFLLLDPECDFIAFNACNVYQQQSLYGATSLRSRGFSWGGYASVLPTLAPDLFSIAVAPF